MSNVYKHVLQQNRSCFGCCAKSPFIALDEPSKGIRIQGHVVNKPSISDDYFWSTSTCDLEISTIQSQRSFSSISTSNQCLTSTSNHSEFVNQGNAMGHASISIVSLGLLLWNQSRLQWRGTKKSQSPQKVQESVLSVYSWNASYEAMLGTSKRFTQPVPLSEMVDFLVDIWDQEGLYD
ncbi:hypothetical protein BUALT_Bualt16G0069900 [Buddleja alternifolia]|uniref:Gag1-like clamp domain-containing protein n=1 Tax=Buddleja alternifolia TaxID=168488 RepID=A0AAV6WBI1_9LAMI|nr:hypothetical protein BUALT_Bualt16G0069900 [Buddleja alternifolia]